MKQNCKDDYSILGLKTGAPIETVVKSFNLRFKRAKNVDKQKEFCLAYCNICNNRQIELYKYFFKKFLENYQELSLKQMKTIVKQINGNV